MRTITITITMTKSLAFVVLLLALLAARAAEGQTAPADAGQEAMGIVSGCTAVFTSPPGQVPRPATWWRFPASRSSIHRTM